jgi:hypothetical protein
MPVRIVGSGEAELLFLLGPDHRQTPGEPGDGQIGGARPSVIALMMRGDRQAGGARKRTWRSAGFSRSQIVDVGSFGPVFRFGRAVRFFHLATVFQRIAPFRRKERTIKTWDRTFKQIPSA